MIDSINPAFFHSVEFAITTFMMSFIFFFSLYAVIREKHTPFKYDYFSGVIYIFFISSFFAMLVGVFIPRLLLIKDIEVLLDHKDLINAVMCFYLVIVMSSYIKLYEVSFMKEKYDCRYQKKVSRNFDGFDFMIGAVFMFLFSILLTFMTMLMLQCAKPLIKDMVKKDVVAIHYNSNFTSGLVIVNDKQSFALYFYQDKLKIELPKNWYVQNEDAVIRFVSDSEGKNLFLTFTNIRDHYTCRSVLKEASALNAKVMWLDEQKACSNNNNFALLIPFILNCTNLIT